MKAFVLVLIGAILGGMFINEKLSSPKATEEKPKSSMVPVLVQTVISIWSPLVKVHHG